MPGNVATDQALPVRMPAYPAFLYGARLFVCAIGLGVGLLTEPGSRTPPELMMALSVACGASAVWTLWVMATAWIEVTETELRWLRPRLFDPLPDPRGVPRGAIAAVALERGTKMGPWLVLRLGDGKREQLSPLMPSISFNEIETQGRHLAALLGVPLEQPQ